MYIKENIDKDKLVIFLLRYSNVDRVIHCLLNVNNGRVYVPSYAHNATKPRQ